MMSLEMFEDLYFIILTLLQGCSFSGEKGESKTNPGILRGLKI